MNDINEFNKYVEFRRNFIYVSDLKIESIKKQIETIMSEHPDYESDPQYKKIIEDAMVKMKNIGYRKELAEKDLTNDNFYNIMLDEILSNQDKQSSENKSRLI